MPNCYLILNKTKHYMSCKNVTRYSFKPYSGRTSHIDGIWPVN
ncbi:hypothetical protein NEIMUCOT_04200 [Neisseria mucosa ATCC 25996]|uniref:Uncharacterized protein n=1 Tax=Neisseria mucosa (strain ATCC 25996 / DSM 4631 / NCTC 10774 / M26) TaxID=546266 RepID=D2ZUB2_NEIM2|nr:hypothetical protein NEIMUCOT_04200 [Neisseria mucosa ATCC 25996]